MRALWRGAPRWRLAATRTRRSFLAPAVAGALAAADYVFGGPASLVGGRAKPDGGDVGAAGLGVTPAERPGVEPPHADATQVRAAYARRATLVLPVAATGVATTRRTTLNAPTTGRVQRVAVRESDLVARGEVLVVLDTTEQAIAVAQAEAERRRAEVQLRDLTVLDERVLDSASRAERWAAARAKSGLDVAELAVTRARLDLSRGLLQAPFDGRAADVRAVTGGWVRAGDPLLSVVTLDPIRIEAQVLESDVPSVAPGRAAAVTFPAFPGESFVGRVESINPAVDLDTRAARVTVRLANPGGRILPGMYARVRIDGQLLRDRVLVPRAAVLERDRRTMLFVYEGDSTLGAAKWRYVVLGAGNDSLVEVLADQGGDGLRPGELVLVEGHETLTHGALVHLAPQRGGTEPSADPAPARSRAAARTGGTR